MNYTSDVQLNDVVLLTCLMCLSYDRSVALILCLPINM